MARRGRWGIGAATVLALVVLTGAARGRADLDTDGRTLTGVASALEAVHAATGAGERGSSADGFVAATRLSERCRNAPQRMVRSGPNKYALGRCGTESPRWFRTLPRPTRRLLPEAAFASLVADDTCVTDRCIAQARSSHASWVIARGQTGVRPRTTAACARYRNIDFAADRAVAADRLRGTIPKGRKVHWRYASRGGRWVMAYWSGGGRDAWAFIPRSCVADPPTYAQIALWRHEHRALNQQRPDTGRRFRVVRPALPCPGRLRCAAAE